MVSVHGKCQRCLKYVDVPRSEISLRTAVPWVHALNEAYDAFVCFLSESLIVRIWILYESEQDIAVKLRLAVAVAENDRRLNGYLAAILRVFLLQPSARL